MNLAKEAYFCEIFTKHSFRALHRRAFILLPPPKFTRSLVTLGSDIYQCVEILKA
jgi:hypothetical protein